MTEQSTVVNVLPATTKRSYQHLAAAAVVAAGAFIQVLQQVWPELIKYYPKLAALGPFVTMAGALSMAYLRAREPAKAQPVDLSPQGQVSVLGQGDKPHAE